ncbi:MAG: hypothetical protein ACE5I7_12155 [Candidatus Binatia bacterium]
MHRYFKRIALVSAGMLVGLLAVRAGAAGLSAAIQKKLATSKYVYIASTRKDGTLSKPAEIWFLYHQGAVYVGTPPTTWRARRIRAGRTRAKIWVGKPNGPSFMATGAIVSDPTVEQAMFETYAKKYPAGWPRFAEKFRTGFKSGSRVLIKYTPADGSSTKGGSSD